MTKIIAMTVASEVESQWFQICSVFLNSLINTDNPKTGWQRHNEARNCRGKDNIALNGRGLESSFRIMAYLGS